MRLVSVVVPLWLIATTSVSDMSSPSWNPDSSVAVSASTAIDRPHSEPSSIATLRPAMAAVPWPITLTREIRPSARASRTASGSESVPRSARSRPSRSAMRPRNVLRTLDGASEISFARKWRCGPRSMSRVVTSAVARSSSASGSARPP